MPMVVRTVRTSGALEQVPANRIGQARSPGVVTLTVLVPFAWFVMSAEAYRGGA